MLLARLKSKQANMSLVVCYAPTNTSPDESKDAFFEQLQDVLSSIPDRDIKIVLGDFNAKVGSNNHGNYRNHIDHVMIGKQRCNSLRDVRTYTCRGADVGSDHQMVVATVQLKLETRERSEELTSYDTKKLLDPQIKEEFQLECRNRFIVLETLNEEEPGVSEVENMECGYPMNRH
ncbi:craniofacial development protein 2-like [Homarus americanus]|uniref:craniofacial development protein 2-like n=1 Tax=Homarus americanus TaxID=6706 RepID=UPI001C45521C|nr:craniofacial development protein 2-like [Homarus americanus]